MGKKLTNRIRPPYRRDKNISFKCRGRDLNPRPPDFLALAFDEPFSFAYESGALTRLSHPDMR